MVNNSKRGNDLTGKEWLQNSFSIWRDLSKSAEEKKMQHPASYPVALCEKLIKIYFIVKKQKQPYKILKL